MNLKTEIANKSKYIIIRDDNGVEIQRIELDDNERQNTFKKRNKKRNLKQMRKHNYCIQHSLIFSRDPKSLNDLIDINFATYNPDSDDSDYIFQFSEISLEQLDDLKL